MFRRTSAIALVAAAIYACSDDDEAGMLTPTVPADAGATVPDATAPVPDAAPGSVAVSLKFAAKVGTQAFGCGSTYAGLGTTAEEARPRDLRFFVQDVKLIDGAGVEVPVALERRAPWQTSDVALLDFEDGTGLCSNGTTEVNAVVTGTVPAGTYRGIVFTNGVPEAVNHLDPATEEAPLSAGGMTWGWLFGHLFVKAEMSATDGGGIGLFHLGSTGCVNTAGDGGTSDFGKGPSMACSNPNRNLVKLADFDPATSTVVLDVANVFAGTSLSVSSQCHGAGAACPPMFASVGIDMDGGVRMPSAPAFRVE